MDGFKACFKPFVVSSFFIKRKEHSNRGYRKKTFFNRPEEDFWVQKKQGHPVNYPGRGVPQKICDQPSGWPPDF